MNHTPTPLEKLRTFLDFIRLSEFNKDKIKDIVVEIVSNEYDNGKKSCDTEIAQLKDNVAELEQGIKDAIAEMERLKEAKHMSIHPYHDGKKAGYSRSIIILTSKTNIP